MTDSNNAMTRAVQAIPPAVRVVKRGAGLALPLVAGEGSAVAIVWPGMGAQHRTIHRFNLGPLASTVPQQHAGEAVYAVLEGDATIVDLADGESRTLTVGAMIHLDPETRYNFRAGESGAVILGGPCPPDPGLYPTD